MYSVVERSKKKYSVAEHKREQINLCIIEMKNKLFLYLLVESINIINNGVKEIKNYRYCH